MITIQQLAAVRAALQYWKEEMGPHGIDVMRPYLEPSDMEPLTVTEIDDLRQQLDPAILRYAILAAGTERLTGTQLHTTAETASRAADSDIRVATVLLPVS